nr:cyclic nucleotide-binding domain-containing protein [uncultured Sphaerochaeta sp.]
MKRELLFFPLIWNIIVSAAAIYSVIFIPYDLVFKTYAQFHHEISNWIVIGIFLADLFFNIFNHQTFVVVDPFEESSSVDRYISTYFVFDVMAALPLGVIFGLPVLQLFHLAKIVKVANLIKRLKQRVIKYSNIMTMTFFIFWMSLSSHLISCGWLALRDRNLELDNISNYISSLYWAVTTLTTVGYGDITPVTNSQMIFTIFVMILGVGIYGYIIGNVASIISKKDPAKARYFDNIENLTALVAYRNIPLNLQKRIQQYYKYVFHKRMGYDENDFLHNLPKSLKTEVSLYLKKSLIENNDLFKGASQEFIKEISLKLKPLILVPDDCLFRHGDIGDEMYFIVKGSLSVYREDKKEKIATLSEGSYFGEIALLKDIPRTATIIADTYCDLYSLNKATFDYVVKKYPDIAAKVSSIVKEREKKHSNY